MVAPLTGAPDGFTSCSGSRPRGTVTWAVPPGWELRLAIAELTASAGQSPAAIE